MLRGKTTFICTKCDHRFEAMDIEYQGTAYSTPMPCPKCGSRRTRPAQLPSFLSFLDKGNGAYERIWDEMEKEQI